MASQFHPNGNTITVDNYDNALHIIKQKLYDGDYFTSTDSSINKHIIEEFIDIKSSRVRTLVYL